MPWVHGTEDAPGTGALESQSFCHAGENMDGITYQDCKLPRVRDLASKTLDIGCFTPEYGSVWSHCLYDFARSPDPNTVYSALCPQRRSAQGGCSCESAVKETEAQRTGGDQLLCFAYGYSVSSRSVCWKLHPLCGGTEVGPSTREHQPQKGLIKFSWDPAQFSRDVVKKSGKGL